MQTEILSPRHWEWPGGCYSMAASPPSCHPAHSLSSMPLIVLGRGGPFLLTHLSCSCSSRDQPWGRESVGRVWMWHGFPWFWTFLQLHTSLLSRRHQLRQAWDKELWQYPTTRHARRKGIHWRRGLCLLQTGRGLLVSILLFSLLWGNTLTRTNAAHPPAFDVPKLRTRKYFRERMRGIDFFVRGSIFLPGDVFQIYENCNRLRHRQPGWPWQSCFVLSFHCHLHATWTNTQLPYLFHFLYKETKFKTLWASKNVVKGKRMPMEIPPLAIFLTLCLTLSRLSSCLLSHFLSNRCSIFTRKSSRGIRWRTEAKWSDGSTYRRCLRSPWPPILLEVDICAGLAHGCMREKVGRWGRLGWGGVTAQEPMLLMTKPRKES